MSRGFILHHSIYYKAFEFPFAYINAYCIFKHHLSLSLSLFRPLFFDTFFLSFVHKYDLRDLSKKDIFPSSFILHHQILLTRLIRQGVSVSEKGILESGSSFGILFIFYFSYFIFVGCFYLNSSQTF